MRFIPFIILLFWSLNANAFPRGGASSPQVYVAAVGTGFGYFSSSNNTVNVSGDTYIFTAWAPASLGGGTFGQVNDPGGNALCPNCGDHISSLVGVTINATTPTANTTTVAVLNNNNIMSGYSTSTPCSFYSHASWYRNGIHYHNVYCLGGASFFSNESTIIMSPDDIHTCNPATYATGGNGGPNSCDSGNWSTTGDVPVSLGAPTMLWPGTGMGDNSHAMSVLTAINSYQDGQTCVSIPGDDNCTYDMFYSENGDYTNKYVSRVAKAASPMILGNWQYYQGGDITNDANWSTNLAGSKAVVTKATFNNSYYIAAIWLPDFNSVLLCGQSDSTTIPTTGTDDCMAAPNPSGPYGPISTVIAPPCPAPNATSAGYGGPSLVPSTVVTISTSPPHDHVIMATAGSYLLASGTQSQNCYTPFFNQLDITRH